MAIKMTQQEALDMTKTADMIAPVTQPAKRQPAKRQPAVVNQGVEEAVRDVIKQASKTKVCSKCGRELTLDQFPARGAWCKDCRRVYDRQRRAVKSPQQATGKADPSPAVADYVAQEDIALEVTGTGRWVIAQICAAVDLLAEDRRYRLTMIVKEA